MLVVLARRPTDDIGIALLASDSALVLEALYSALRVVRVEMRKIENGARVTRVVDGS